MSTGGIRRSTRNRVLAAVLILLFALTIWQTYTAIPVLGAHGILADFDAFYITGQLVLDGRAAEAHDALAMAEIQRGLTGQEAFMPWTYPPQFDLLTAPLPLVPRGLSYALFTGTTLALFLWLLSDLAGPSFFAVLLAGAIPVYVNASVGQNAFLTGALMAGFVRLSLAGRTLAGLPLGLMVIKPHLGLGIGLHALFRARWAVLGIAIAIGLLSGALATLALGPGIWAAFLTGLAQAREALSGQFYPLYRMASLYALLHGLGLPPAAALTAQIALALGATLAMARAIHRGVPLRWTLAMGCFSSTLVSPYLYDYDLVLALVGGALLAGDVLRRSDFADRLLLLCLSWIAGGWGLFHALMTMDLTLDERARGMAGVTPFGAVAYLLLLAMLWRILRREVRA